MADPFLAGPMAIILQHQALWLKSCLVPSGNAQELLVASC